MGFGSSAGCECGAEQTVDHVVLYCPIHRPPYELHGLTVLDDETTEWLLNTCPNIKASKQLIKEELAQTKENHLASVYRWHISF